LADLILHTLADCALVIGAYPRFRYDATGGRGLGRLGPVAANGAQALRFDPETLTIPPLDWRSTRFLGLPLPPPLSIRLQPEQLEGSLAPGSGALELRFRARFRFAIGSLYRAPDLLVATTLSTGSVRGRRHQASGQPLAGDGQALVVGVATIAPCGDPWLDRFLGLPEEALALLRCRLLPATGPALP
jgi:hypothetical protein